MERAKIDDLRNRIIELNTRYREGDPVVSDAEYDALLEELRSKAPDDALFRSGIIEAPTDRMEPLPVPMYSLEKAKTTAELVKWLRKMREAGAERVVVSPKFDGISLVVDEYTGKAWTRGNGVEGQRSDTHYRHMANGFCSDALDLEESLITWGEAIVPRNAFDPEQSGYKNARNMVAGIFNSPEGHTNPQIENVRYVRYGTLYEEPYYRKSEQFNDLEDAFNWVSPHSVFDIGLLLEAGGLDERCDALFSDYGLEYKIDGLVFEVDEFDVRHRIGRLPNNNPGYAVALKKPEWSETYETVVEAVEFGIGKTGILNPVMVVAPVEMEGATVRRASVYNAKYIIEHSIHPGARIEIMRSGDVIPKHLRTLSYDEETLKVFLQKMATCPSCGEPLFIDDTETNLVCRNPDCRERRIAEIVYFFRTMGCEEFEEPTIRTLYDLGLTTAQRVASMSLPEMKRCLGEKKGEVVFNQIRRVTTEGVPMARFLNALNLFEGRLAEKTLQKIFDQSGVDVFEAVLDDEEALVERLQSIDGVAEITARIFVRGLKRFYTGEAPEVEISYTVSPEKGPLREDCLYVCMTGFRSRALEEALVAQGHVVVDGVTKQCNVLVVADLNSTSSKMRKAQERGIRIVERTAFENEIIP